MTKQVEQDIAMQNHKIATYELIWVSERSVLSKVSLNYRHVLCFNNFCAVLRTGEAAVPQYRCHCDAYSQIQTTF